MADACTFQVLRSLTSLTLSSGIAQDDIKNYSVETGSC